MDSMVEKLEATFVKSEADLDYMEKCLKLDFIHRATEHPSSSEVNPVLMLEKLKTIRARHSALSSKVKQILESQKLSMDLISYNLNRVLEQIHHFEQTTDLEIEPLTESDKDSAALLSSASSHQH